MKKLIAIVMTACLALSMAACSTSATATTTAAAASTDAAATTAAAADSTAAATEQSATTAGKKLKIGFIFMSLADVSLTAIKEDAKAECDALGIDLTVVDGNADSATQITAIEDMITAGMDAIIIQAADKTALTPYLQKAMDAGIKVLAFGIATEVNDAWYRNDPVVIGTAVGTSAGEWINANLGGEATVGILDFPMVPSLIIRADNMKAALLKTCPNVKIVATNSAIDTETALNMVENMLQATPDINVICSLSDGAGLGAVEAFKAAGKDSTKCAVFGSDISQLGAQALIEGGFYKGSISVDSLVLGKNAIDLCVKLVNGEPVDKEVFMAVTPVDASNAADFLK